MLPWFEPNPFRKRVFPVVVQSWEAIEPQDETLDRYTRLVAVAVTLEKVHAIMLKRTFYLAASHRQIKNSFSASFAALRWKSYFGQACVKVSFQFAFGGCSFRARKSSSFEIRLAGARRVFLTCARIKGGKSVGKSEDFKVIAVQDSWNSSRIPLKPGRILPVP